MPPFKLLPGSPADHNEMTSVWIEAMAADPFWRTWMASMTKEEIHAWLKPNIHYRIVTGPNLGVMQTWKAVDESNGRIAAWTGLSMPWPDSLTDEQRASLSMNWTSPEGGNTKAGKWFGANVGPMPAEAGFDRSKHFWRQGSMVHPSYQRRGLMSLLTQKCNSIADEYGAPTYVNARPNASSMFHQQGYEVCSSVDVELGDFEEGMRGKGELENGMTRFRTMRREVGAKGVKRKLGDEK